MVNLKYTSPGVGYLDARYLMLDASNDPITGDLTLNENLELKDDKHLYFDTDKENSLRWDTNTHSIHFDLHGAYASRITFPGATTFFANTGSDGDGTWQPEISLAADGAVNIQNTTQSTAKHLYVGMSDGIQLDTTDTNFAIIKADNIAASNKTFQFPNDSGTLAIQDYVDKAVGFHFDYFFNNTVSGIGGIYYNMTDTDLGGAETTDIEVTSLTSDTDDQALFNFATLSGEPGIEQLEAGVYDIHAHIERTGGNSSVNVYAELWKRTTAPAETLLATSEVTAAITSKESIDFHFVLTSATTITTTDRLVLKFFANVGLGSGADVELYAEGTTDSHFTFQTTSGILSTLYIRQDGTTAFSGNQDFGTNDITGVGSLGVTGTRLTKGWFTDLESTNDITIGGTALASIYAAIAQTFYIGTTQVAINRTSATLNLAGIGTLGVGAITSSGTLALAANDITMTGSIGVTGSRVTKLWATAVEVTNAAGLTIGGTASSSVFAAINQTMYIGTTGVAINRGSGALTLAGLTLTTPDIGTPTAGVLSSCTALPAAQVSAGTFAGALEAADHGTAATDQIVNVAYGTGAAPAANTTTIGSLYITYTT